MRFLFEYSLARKSSCEALLILALACTVPSLASSQSYYRNEPFDATTKVLPHPYYGYDPAEYFKVAREEAVSEQKARTKDEFETTAQYEERLKSIDPSNPLAANTYAFGVKSTKVSYDADKQTFTLTFRPQEAQGNALYQWTTLQTAVQDTGQHEAQNGFGAVFTVQESSISIYELWLAKAQGLPGCTATANVAPAEARSMNPDICALTLLRPVAPFESMDKEYSEATLSSPSETMTATARIFGRLVGVRFYGWVTGCLLRSCP